MISKNRKLLIFVSIGLAVPAAYLVLAWQALKDRPHEIIDVKNVGLNNLTISECRSLGIDVYFLRKIERYRHDEIWFLGVATAAELQESAISKTDYFLKTGLHGLEPGRLRDGNEVFPEGLGQPWENSYWIIHGRMPDGSLFNVGFDQESGTVWGFSVPVNNLNE